MQGVVVFADMDSSTVILDDGTGVAPVTLLFPEIKDANNVIDLQSDAKIKVSVHCTICDDIETDDPSDGGSSIVRLAASRVHPVYNTNAASLWITEVLLSHSKYSSAYRL